jgi:hypothetical protein
MKANQKTRMCWNCEGRVSDREETCPYCGVSVVPASLDGGEESVQSPFQALFSNYQTDIPADIPPSPYAVHKDFTSETFERQEFKKEPEEEEEESEAISEPSSEGFKKGFLAILFLLAGSMLFLFGLTLALFSNKGVFTLSWDASFWFVYGGLSLPLLFLGWKLLSHLEDDH